MNQENESASSQEVTGYFVPVAKTRTTDTSSLIDVRELLLRYRSLLLAGTILGAIALFAISYLLAPKYRVEVLLAPVEYSQGGGALSQMGGALGGLGALAGLSLGDSSSRSESLAVLNSKSLTTSFIQELDLLTVLFASEWNSATGSWKPTDVDDIPSIEDGFRTFDKDVRTVSLERETGLVTLAITWIDRHQAAEWANRLVDLANTAIRERAVSEYRRSIDYLNSELENTTVVGVRQAIYSVIESQIEQVMLATVRDDYAFKVLDPAVPPDVDDIAFPNRPLFALAGLVLGFGLSAAMALWLFRRRQSAGGN